jgi:hypothetical protein
LSSVFMLLFPPCVSLPGAGIIKIGHQPRKGVSMMYEWIKTDNEFANAEFRNRLVGDPVLAALIDLLVQKGVINLTELGTVVNERCQALVSAREKIEREGGEA